MKNPSSWEDPPEDDEEDRQRIIGREINRDLDRAMESDPIEDRDCDYWERLE